MFLVGTIDFPRPRGASQQGFLMGQGWKVRPTLEACAQEPGLEYSPGGLGLFKPSVPQSPHLESEDNERHLSHGVVRIKCSAHVSRAMWMAVGTLNCGRQWVLSIVALLCDTLLNWGLG